MSKRRYHRRSKMKRRGVKHGSQNGSKMAPKWLQNGSKMAPWRPLGGPWARPCCRRSPEPSRRGSGTARGVPKKIILAALERPWSEKWIDFGLLERPREVPEGVWEVIWGAFWRLGRRERKKSRKVTKQSVFLELFLHAFSYRSRVCSVRLSARRRESTT